MRGRGPKGYTRADERIREDVCDSFTHDPLLDAGDIEVGVAGGEVTLAASPQRGIKRVPAFSIAAFCTRSRWEPLARQSSSFVSERAASLPSLPAIVLPNQYPSAFHRPSHGCGCLSNSAQRMPRFRPPIGRVEQLVDKMASGNIDRLMRPMRPLLG
jgi:hypothetical protein